MFLHVRHRTPSERNLNGLRSIRSLGSRAILLFISIGSRFIITSSIIIIIIVTSIIICESFCRIKDWRQRRPARRGFPRSSALSLHRTSIRRALEASGDRLRRWSCRSNIGAGRS
jgi:hypothetical protein